MRLFARPDAKFSRSVTRRRPASRHRIGSEYTHTYATLVCIRCLKCIDLLLMKNILQVRTLNDVNRLLVMGYILRFFEESTICSLYLKIARYSRSPARSWGCATELVVTLLGMREVVLIRDKAHMDLVGCIPTLLYPFDMGMLLSHDAPRKKACLKYHVIGCFLLISAILGSIALD